MRPLVLIALAGAAISGPALSQANAGAFTIAGTNQSFAQLDEALAALNGGDGTIRIAPGTYRQCAVQEKGRVAYVAEKPGTAIFERVTCEGKAALVLRGEGSRVEGIVFRHLEVADGNGAGIRMEKGDLVVTDVMFLDSQCGILSASDPAASIVVDRSTFSGLGKDPTGHGAHGIYVGGYASLKVTHSRFERGTGGHYVKTRAPRVEIVDNSFDDSRGHETNYMIDLSNGAVGRIAGNTFVQGGDKENRGTLITVAPEGAKNVSDGLVIENNVATLAPAFSGTTTFVGRWSGEDVAIRNNRLAPRIAPTERHWL